MKYLYAALAALAILGAVAFSAYTKGYGDAKIASLEQWSAEVARQQDEALEVTESLSNKNMDALRAKQNEINKLTVRIASLNRQLLDRPSREDDSVSPGASQACTGGELYREDGEFLVGEASAAERIRLERDYYYERYEEARQQLERLKNEN
jgi:hypothetical protein